MRRSAIRGLSALVLSWMVPATSVWSAAAAPVDPSLPSIGILVGQALSDATGLPLPGATVRLAGSPDPAVPVDLEGRYALPVAPGEVVLLVEAPGFTSVEHRATAVAGRGTSILDARPTPLNAPVTVGPSGGPVSAGVVTVTVPSGAVSADTGFVVTPLSGQGLPGRLPLGFAPVQAFDLRAGGSVSGALTVRLTGLPSTSELHLVEYRPGTHAWHVTATSLAVSSGEATSSLPGLGAYAVVIADEGGPAVPGPGAPLVGSASVAAPPGLSGAATVEPIQVPSTGATARGHLTATSPTALPSGTVLQARLTESFTVGGVSIQDEPRVQDVIAYRAQPASGLSLKATLPLTAVRRFSAAELAEGRLHLEFWTGRPDLAGSVGGGTEAVTVESGPARLTVPAGSLDHDTSVSILSVPLSSFLPGAPGVTALGEVVVDLSGALLSQGAELSLAAGATAGETLLIARVERVGGVPYLTVVSLAEAQGGRVVSADYPGLPGIVRGGRYVFYRVNGPVGFVAGSTTSQAGPVSAVVGTAGLPFVGISSASGSYITAARPGAAVEVTATVPGTPHRATATVAVQAGQTASLDLSLTAGLTTVEVLPADGTTGVAVSVAVQVTASQALDELTVTATSVRLIKGNPDTGPAVPAARVLSADGRTLSVVPDAPLDPATVYVLRVTGLKDVFGGPVNVPDTHFTTRADVTPEYDLSKVVFSFPNEAGLVHVSAVAGSFPPGSHVMIVNERNGIVLTLMVDSQGRLDSELPATLDDTLTVSLEDPLGNVVSGRQSRFVDAATGRMAVGATGGVVTGTGGVELRLPEGAVDRGVIFKASSVSPASIPAEQRPSLGAAAVLGAAIAIDAPSVPTFRKEVDLAFPKPADAPPGAFYYVVRKVQGPGGQAFFQTIDTASVEGDKVVTNSPPFGGYVESMGAYSYLGSGAVAVAGTANNMAFLLWSFDSQMPTRAQMGVISGRVTQSQWNPTLRRWEYAPVVGALVRRLVGGVDPFTGGTWTTFATSGPDGTYSFFDAQYIGGIAVVRATDPQTGTERDATGYGIDPLDRPVWAQPYRAMATANIAFTRTTQPAPEIQIRVLEAQAGGGWAFSDGLAVEGQPLVIGVTVANATLEGVTLQGEALALRDGEPEHLGLQKVADYTPQARGPLTIVATARPAAGSPATATASLLVIGEGGDNNTVLEHQAPEVILPSLVPQPDAAGVAPAALLEVGFTEPVTNLPGHVTLHELSPAGAPGPAMPVELIGAGPQGPVPSVAATSQVSFLTIRPPGGLKYGTSYRLLLTSDIHDLDTLDPGDPKPLPAFGMDFRTFSSGPTGGSDEHFYSAGIVVLQDRAWLVENRDLFGTLRTFDVADPVKPLPVGAPFTVTGRPVHLAGTTDHPTFPRLLVVGTSVTGDSRPSNVHVFDVSGDTPRRIGVASVSRSSVDGTLARLQVMGGYAYAITWRKGVQVLDLQRASQNYEGELETYGGTWHLDFLLGHDGMGFGLDAVTATIPVRKPPPPCFPPETCPPPESLPHWLMTDLKVGEYLYQGAVQPLVFVTGELGFAVVNPQAGSAGPPLNLEAGANRLGFGYALALGRIGGKDVAVVVGSGQATHPVTGLPVAGPVLAVLDLGAILQPSAAPKVLSVIPLFGGSFALSSYPSDVVLRDNLAVVAGDSNALVVDLSSLAQPQIRGTIAGIGGHLAVDAQGLLYGTARSVWSGTGELGGIRVASLGPAITVLDQDRKAVSWLELPKHSNAFVRALVPEGDAAIGGVQVSIVKDDDGTLRTPTGSLPTSKPITLVREPDTGYYLAPLRIVDKDCAVELSHNAFDEQVIQTPCDGDLESGPWTRLKIKLPPSYAGAQRDLDLQSFRLVTLGDSLTQGVQHGMVVHQDQRHSYPAQLAGQINELLMQKYGKQMRFTQAMIAEPGIGKPPLGNPYGPGANPNLPFPMPGRLNTEAQPVNNMGMSGAQVAHLRTARRGVWPPYSSWELRRSPKKGLYSTPIYNPEEPKSVWRYVLTPPEVSGAPDLGTAVEQAALLDPSLVVLVIGNNDALKAATSSDEHELTPPEVFAEEFDALTTEILRRTRGRAELIVGTIPDVGSIPHMRDIGERVGPLPFTVPKPIVSDEWLTNVIEHMYLDQRDKFGRCHGVDLGGACLPGAKVGIGTIFDDKKRAAWRTLSQTRLLGLQTGRRPIRLTRDEVMDPDELSNVQEHVNAFNDHIRKRAAENGWPVLDMNRLFKERTTEAAKASPTLLNGLFTGTPRPLAYPGDSFLRGRGNSLLSWDGVHPNSAGYSLVANEAIRVLNQRLANRVFGGLDRETAISLIPSGIITERLKDNYLSLARTRVYLWQQLLTTVE